MYYLLGYIPTYISQLVTSITEAIKPKRHIPRTSAFSASNTLF